MSTQIVTASFHQQLAVFDHASERLAGKQVLHRKNHMLNQSKIYAWKKALTDAAPKVFAGHLGRTDEISERKLAELYQQVGRLMVERDFLLRRSGL